jgi:1-acyl-sn-glycerol-3-phosphate acyltransferase
MMNKRYKDLQVTEGTYVPPVVTDFPEDDPYQGIYKPIYDRDFPEVDANYPYVDDSFRNKLLIEFGYRIVLRLLGLILRVKYGLRSTGKKQLRKYKEQLKGGAITVANHCYRHDAASVLSIVHARSNTRIPMFAPNFKTKDQIFLRMVGGIPIPAPEQGLSAMKAFNAAFDEFHKRGYWFHIFPEAKRWDWYKPIRPFQKGAFTMAYKYDMPIIPCVVTYRPRTGIYRLLGPKNEPLVQVTIGEPIFPEKSQPRAAETERLRQVTHETMCRMAGIVQNTWPVKPDVE